MPNTLFTAAQAARSSLAALRYLSGLPRTVRQDFSGDFVTGKGKTVDVLGPITVAEARVYTAAKRAAREAIVFDDLAQTYYPVTMEDQVYSAVRLPDDFNTFTLANAQQQVFVPQARSVVRGVTNPLHQVMTGISPATGNLAVEAVLDDGSNIRKVIRGLRRVLNKREVPFEQRYIAVGPALENAILSDPLLNKVNESGTDGTLRKAVIGELYGFTIVAEPLFPDYYGVAYVSDAFAHVTRPSANPEGAGASATASADGFALRWLRHYNPQQLEDQSVVDTFVGARILDPERAVSFGAALVGTTINIVDDAETIAVGATFRLEVKDADGTTIPNRLIAWTTSNAGRATVDADGIVTGVAAGTAATITATFQTKTDTAAIVVA